MSNGAKIDPLSMISLYLRVMVNGLQLSTATGFVVEHLGRFFLITNWHVFSGRHAKTDEPLSPTAAIPDAIGIAHHDAGTIDSWTFHNEPLKNADGTPRWIEHPLGRAVDVACLELSTTQEGVRLYPLDLQLADVKLPLEPAMTVSVVGFPFGLRANACYGVWVTGHIATDPDLAYGGFPAFLINATTREGMSGSPVIARGEGPFWSENRVLNPGRILTRFLGIYSGRIHDGLDIGCVWRPSLISELLSRAAA